MYLSKKKFVMSLQFYCRIDHLKVKADHVTSPNGSFKLASVANL